ncbi:hypothetical protein [Lewinella sp. JB7]|uniref:hypothetical protein n=1 Tax=Lewinella sp. JB7 TaxID=2962887 RepID=UPI0020C9EB6C|nr:hypothetical protein [Lewinella sp. JB7]MCP9235295.1 hypothetical protein [Lewinella sp. JB7]
MANEQQTNTWPELAIGLYDKLTGRGAEITYDFDNFEVEVPSSTEDGATRARWKMNGVIRIRTADKESRRDRSDS